MQKKIRFAKRKSNKNIDSNEKKKMDQWIDGLEVTCIKFCNLTLTQPDSDVV